MSIAENPLVGRMKGSMANFTMYTLNNQNVVRGKTFNFKDAKTEDQLVMRERMDLLNEKYQSFATLIRMGFPERPIKLNSQNMFISVNFSTAFVVIDGMQMISYPLLKLSQGSLPVVKVMEAVVEDEGIAIKYDNKLVSPEVDATDEILACAILITGGLLIAKQFIGSDDIGTILLKYPAMHADDILCCYVFIRSGDGKLASNSVYVKVKG